MILPVKVMILHHWNWRLHLGVGSQSIGGGHKGLPWSIRPQHNALFTRRSVLFGSIKRKIKLPLNFDCDFHWQDKVNYSIPRPNTWSPRVRIEESLTSMIIVWHILQVLWRDIVLSPSGTLHDCLLVAPNIVIQYMLEQVPCKDVTKGLVEDY